MEPSSSSTPKKLKFVPKVPPRRKSERLLKSVKRNAEDDAETQRLLKNLYERTHKPSRSSQSSLSSVGVSFGGGAPTTYPSPLRTLAAALDESIGADDEDIKFPEVLQETMEEETDSETERAYIEPWNYESGHYPVVLPLRNPYSGDPEILNEAEFSEATMIKVHNKKENDAKQLRLLEASPEPKLLFFQLPRSVPVPKQEAMSINGKEVNQISDYDRKGKGPATAIVTPTPAAAKPQQQGLQTPATWKDLPSGHVGKLLVYKSGKVKLKMGETLFNVAPGSEGNACEDVVAVNPKLGQFSRLGKVDLHVVVDPDVDSILKDR